MKHFGVWVVAGMLLIPVTWWLAVRVFGSTTVERVSCLTSFVGPVVLLFLVERWRGARPSSISVLAVLAASGAMAWFDKLDARWWVKGILFFFIVTPLLAIANSAYRSDMRRAQRRRDQLAADLIGRLRGGDEVEPFVLFLRPFASTNRLSAQPVHSAVDSSSVPSHLDVETLLERSLRNQCSFVALGCSGEIDEGAARVTTSEGRWRDTVRLLARQASFVVMVPLSRPGTMWELQWLAEKDLLGKTLLIMPETVREPPGGVVSTVDQDGIFDGGISYYNSAEHTLELAREWTAAIRVARGFGVGLPPVAAVGALFTLDPKTRRVAKIVPLALSNLASWGRVKYLRAALVHFGLLPPSRRSQLNLIREFRSAVFFGQRTLEYALICAGDGYLAWGETVLGKDLIRQAASEGKPRPQIVQHYLDALPSLVEGRFNYGDRDGARHYLEFGRLLLVDRDLSWLASKETNSKIAALIGSGESPKKPELEDKAVGYP